MNLPSKNITRKVSTLRDVRKSGKLTNTQSDVRKSLSRDRKSQAKRTVSTSRGDRGDQRKFHDPVSGDDPISMPSEDMMPREVLPSQNPLRKQVLRIVRKQKKCDLDDLILECTSYSWTQVFLEVDYLTRTGELRLLCKKAGEYAVTLPRAA